MDTRIERKKQKRKKIKRRRLKRYFNIFLMIIFIGLIIVFLTDRYLYSVVNVEGDSMQRSLYEGDRILIKKIDINTNNIEQDDIISFIGNDDRLYIKRVIGVPGDVIEIVNNKVFVNGIEKDEPYIKGDSTESYNQNKWFVREDEFFVLGDNRLKDLSKDSRILGTIRIDQIKGKVIYNFSKER